ncbi:MAG: DegV family protein [Lachnospiraceae bacterium]|nr:DegV family protein [Lachnospiraceae bacterium]
MSDYILSCCSTCDLTKEHLEQRDIKFISFHYYINGVEHIDDFGTTISIPDFYHAMDEGAETSTSQVNISEYEEYFSSFLDEGKDVIHLTLSSGISGTLNSALAAAENLRPKYPDRQLIIIDSLAASSGYGMLMDAAADKRDEGLSINELEKWILDNRLNLHHWFFSTTLKYYVKGGRISKASGFFGSALGICPLLHVDELGRLIPMEKIRSKKKVINAIVEKMKERALNGLDYAGRCYMSHSACFEDAKAVADKIEEAFKKLPDPVQIFNVGTVIGSHTGPGTVALYFWGDNRA